MAEPLKNMYSKVYLNNFADVFVKIYPKFDKAKFLNLVFDNDWDKKELKQRMRHISVCLHAVLPSDYKKSIEILKQIMGAENPNEIGMFKEYYWLMPVGKFIEKYGLEEIEK